MYLTKNNSIHWKVGLLEGRPKECQYDYLPPEKIAPTPANNFRRVKHDLLYITEHLFLIYCVLGCVLNKIFIFF